jgi:hypothetical protein
MLAIRTATDLKRVWGSADQVGRAVRPQIAKAVAGSEKAGTAMVQMVFESLDGSASVLHVQRFRHHDWLHE